MGWGPTFWWGITGMGESILGVAVGTGAGRLDLEKKAGCGWSHSPVQGTLLSRGRSCPGDASGTLSYLTMLSVSLLAAILILFWASRWVMPSVLTPSMAVMMSPWARLPFTALLPGVICA